MKCARCGHDSTYPQRTDRVCPNCKKKFAFEPRTGDPINDVAWKSALDQVSSNGTVRFTRANLHQAVARRIKRPDSSSSGWVMIAIGGILMVVALVVGSFVPGVLGVGFLFFGALLAFAKTPEGLTLDARTFDQLYTRWVAAHGAPAKLIEPRSAAQLPAPEMAAELEQYSFDRAVICDRPETVDLLLGNDFHFENNCAVLTVDGYPRHAAPTVRKMLRQNPRIEVFALHDATPDGCALAHTLRHDPEWFGGTDVRIYDVALRPAQAAKMPTLIVKETRAVMPHPSLSETERRWLEQHWMSLAALSPEQLIKRLYRAINRMPEITASTGDAGATSGDAIILWSTDAHASDGGGDSFG
jgi:DNA-directed RNA polymerase subunit RPC12/RpoP